MREPEDRDLYWADFHKHAVVDRIDEVMAGAKQHLDIHPPLLYPREYYRQGREGGLSQEFGGNRRPELFEQWERINAAAAEYNDPGEFVAFPAYEWHGDATGYGHHNVYYFEEGYPLDDAERLEDLFENVKDREGLVLPHHTGFKPGCLGKKWDVHDPALSPVVEMYDGHGSSEGVGAPLPGLGNPGMGPRTSGGTYQDALDRGLRVGAIASNDWSGLPGSWDLGLAGVWAEELTRAGVREALEARRTFGVTGDRIQLWYEVGGHPMGAAVPERDLGERTATVSVACPQPLDRVELVHDGHVVDAYTHQDAWDRAADHHLFNVLVEVGSGPAEGYADWQETTEVAWNGTVTVEEGSLEAVHPRYDGLGIDCEHDDAYAFELYTDRAPEPNDRYLRSGTEWQGFVCTVRGADATLVIDLAADEESGLVPEERLVVPLAEARDSDHLFDFTDAVADRLVDSFHVPRSELEPATRYNNAAKVKVHPACPVAACRAEVTFTALPVSGGTDYYYARVTQVDGQRAWSSPVWVT